MQNHQIKKPKHLKKKNRVGRGGKRGTFSGRGVKGQKARAGARIRPQIWDYITQIPKLTGPTNKGGEKIGRTPAVVFEVNLNVVDKITKSGDVVNALFLVKKGVLRKHKGRVPNAKILGKGEIKKKITVQGLKVSSSAKEKIEKAGGEIK